MKLGDRGSDGKQVQGRLIEVGYDLDPLGADGIRCEATWKALEELAAARDLAWSPAVPAKLLTAPRMSRSAFSVRSALESMTSTLAIGPPSAWR